MSGGAAGCAEVKGNCAEAGGTCAEGGSINQGGRVGAMPVMAALMAELKSAASMVPDGPGALDGGVLANASIASRSCRCRWSPSSAPGAACMAIQFSISTM